MRGRVFFRRRGSAVRSRTDSAQEDAGLILRISCFVPLEFAKRVQRPRKRQTACKPGSVREIPRVDRGTSRDDHSSGTRLTARLTRPTRAAGRERPRVLACNGRRGRPYSVLLPVGFTLPPPLPAARGALTAPFHPCPTRVSTRRAVCFLWHFPWGRPRRPLAGTVFPWSPDFPPSSRDNSGRPAVWRARHGTAPVGTSSARRRNVLARALLSDGHPRRRTAHDRHRNYRARFI
jgi:hypothetical protein